ncbi:MAG: hypothetical protein JXA77_00930 [Bacteroidales bacterium]|nr:hypothetical protein [Bacteroidales bacterium]MBN2817694.1 hypothetical protein [Bacteroidales bacterium]
MRFYKAFFVIILCTSIIKSYAQDTVPFDTIFISTPDNLHHTLEIVLETDSTYADSILIETKEPVLFGIASRSRKGYKDLTLVIVEKHLEDGVWNIKAMGTYNDSVVGLGIRIKDSLRPGLKNGTIDNTTWAREGVEILSIGAESDNFVRILSEMYGYQTRKSFTTKPLVFTCFSLNTEIAALETGHFEFKLYFDDSNESGIYSEIFFNTNLPAGIIEFPDKDPIHFDGFLKALVR